MERKKRRGEEVELRMKIDKEMRLKEQERKEEELCALAKIPRLQTKMMREK